MNFNCEKTCSNPELKDILALISKKLALASPTPHLDAELILMHVLKKPRHWLYLNHKTRINFKQKQKILKLTKERTKNRLPMAYLTGVKNFYGLRFKINKNTLIPRPETELLVDEILRALEIIQHPKNRAANNRSILIADIGTGTGCIIIACAKNIKDKKHLSFIATDKNKKTLDLARKNLKNHGLEKIIQLKKAGLLAALSKKNLKKFQYLIISANLPYLSARKYQKTQPEIKHEPRQALIASDSGAGLIKKALTQIFKIKQQLASLNIQAFFEIDPGQRKLLKRFIKEKQKSSPCLSSFNVQFKKDLNQRWRLLKLSSDKLKKSQK
ncbi:MAG: HemK/PrmC family methyltransferase [Patescibacteria group bacterium]|nr:peptide chain release factor N(5)-glutamine methyltransferase [Patescibacteria group bacterium]